MSFESIGKPIRRKEDLRLITGQGQFTDDHSRADQVWAWMVRSPHPHAKIVSIDKRTALAMPGVLAVLTGEDVRNDHLQPIDHNPVPSTDFDIKLTGPKHTPVFIGQHHLLPMNKTRFVGEAVAMVVAETREQAFLASEHVFVEYEELDFVVDTELATQDGAPKIWDDIATNVLVDSSFGNASETEAAFAKAKHIVHFKDHVQRVTAVTMEPRASFGIYDSQTDQYTLYAGSGGAVRQKHELAKTLGIDPGKLRVLSLDVGGNFGSRNRTYVEYGLVLWASKIVQRPVKFRADRTESFLSDYQGRDLVTQLSLALDENGRFLALKVDNISNVGYCCASLSALSKGAGLITGNYAIPWVTLRARAVFTNTMCTQAYRSSGRPEVTYAIERIIDKAAHELGFDRLELRRLNLIAATQMPYVNAMGLEYDSGNYEQNMKRILELSDWTGSQERKKLAQAQGKLYGVGFANYVESSIGSPKERVDLIVTADKLEVVIGTQSAGQGHETSFAQVCSDLLDIPFEKIFIIAGDTERVSAGGGTHSGRSLRHASTVISIACHPLIEQARSILSEVLSIPIEQVQYDKGQFSVQASNQSWSWFEVAALSAQSLQSSTKALKVRVDNEMHTPVFPNGACVCEVEIDPHTGGLTLKRYSSVDDVGRCINPMIVHGQTHGGIAQGVGQALWESCVLDPASGQPMSSSLMDYGMPRFDNMPSYATQIIEVHSPTNPLGIKAGGEGGTTPALAVIMSAIEDALFEHCGALNFSMPATPLKIWNALQNSKSLNLNSKKANA